MLEELLKVTGGKFILLCKTHKVKLLYAFGSSITSDYHSDSDVDLIVEVNEPDPLNRGELLLSLWNELELLLGKKVDLLTFDSVRNIFLEEEIEKTKILIYDGSKEEIV